MQSQSNIAQNLAVWHACAIAITADGGMCEKNPIGKLLCGTIP